MTLKTSKIDNLIDALNHSIKSNKGYSLDVIELSNLLEFISDLELDLENLRDKQTEKDYGY